MELLPLWPAALPIDHWDSDKSDELYESDEFVDKWVSYGNSLSKRKRDVDFTSRLSARKQGELIEVPNQPATDIDKRFFWIAIAIAATATAARVAAAAAKAAKAAKEAVKVARDTVKIGKGASSKKSRKEQSDGARTISENKNWKNCLQRLGPT